MFAAMPPLLSESDALARVLAEIVPLPAEPLPLGKAHGRFSATELLATVPLPGFDNSAMDGYALPARADGAAWPAGARFRVTREQPAGPDRGWQLAADSGEAVRIFTGAPVPAGTGAVVMQEDTDVADIGPGRASAGENEDDGTRTITLRESVEPGEFIRRAGGDVTRGQRLLTVGERLSAPALALASSQGCADLAVGRAPRVAVLTTGDELRAAGSGPLGPGEIYESNGVMLAALAEAAVGRSHVTRLEHAPDDTGRLDAQLARGLGGDFEALIIAGGVSVGDHDLVKGRLAAAGVRLELWRVAIKPGKPFLYGRAPGGAHVFGLPGNPVSAFVTFLIFVRPALLKLMGAGAEELRLPAYPAVAAQELTNSGDRPHYLRGGLDATGRFVPAGRQESHALGALGRTRALARLEAGARLPAGAPLMVIPLP